MEYDMYKWYKDDRGYYRNVSLNKKLHRYTWEKYNGPIPEEYDVHHKDEDKDNNDITNLELILHREHTKLHNPGFKKGNIPYNKTEITQEMINDIHLGMGRPTFKKKYGTEGVYRRYKKEDVL